MKFTLRLGILLFFSSLKINSQTLDCGTAPSKEWEPILKARIAAISDLSLKKTLPVSIPFQIHLIVQTDSFSTVSVQDLYDEIDSVNFFYANSNMQYAECSPPEIIYDDSLFDFDKSTEQSILLTQHYTPGVINIYIANTVTSSGSTVCGYAPYPPSSDYIVISASCARNGSTIAHELGHYFGLKHTHGGSADELVDGSNCATEGDLICDTPADPTLTSSNVSSSCVYTGTDVDLNNMAYTPDVTNIMSYSRKICRTSFTPMQYAVISGTQQADRSYLNCTVAGVGGPDHKISVSVFPNPGSTELNFSFTGDAGPASLSIYNSCGQVVFSTEFNSANLKLNTSGFAGGIYFYQLRFQNKTEIGKWIKSGKD
jgi:hypothetical protein